LRFFWTILRSSLFKSTAVEKMPSLLPPSSF
jgi:hypothetical protein